MTRYWHQFKAFTSRNNSRAKGTKYQLPVAVLLRLLANSTSTNSTNHTSTITELVLAPVPVQAAVPVLVPNTGNC